MAFIFSISFGPREFVDFSKYEPPAIVKLVACRQKLLRFQHFDLIIVDNLSKIYFVDIDNFFINIPESKHPGVF